MFETTVYQSLRTSVSIDDLAESPALTIISFLKNDRQPRPYQLRKYRIRT